MARILVVDDDELIRKFIFDLLWVLQHAPMSAKNGREALEQALATPPELMLLDIRMPHPDGLTVLRTLKENPRTAHIKVVALTGTDVENEGRTLLAAGFDGYVSKPVDLKELSALLTRLLESDKSSNPTL